jgi:glycosyltransferase involved in cell wall biosynthesis
VADGITGLLVAPDSSEALASAVCRLLENGDLRRRMALAARERASSLFSWRAIADKVASVHSGAHAAKVGRMQPTGPLAELR